METNTIANSKGINFSGYFTVSEEELEELYRLLEDAKMNGRRLEDVLLEVGGCR
ncbi:hypothetical protein [Thermococcus sp. Bubb.Bath]|uniref:hypothetical protein n=1 Tax=Thermococcus sp. Bubb.Bath TaxID=1638242 RepID=UPI001F1010E9|nr:hypothetical protein [Thermococcus sp. Bubb.Bath]